MINIIHTQTYIHVLHLHCGTKFKRGKDGIIFRLQHIWKYAIKHHTQVRAPSTY